MAEFIEIVFFTIGALSFEMLFVLHRYITSHYVPDIFLGLLFTFMNIAVGLLLSLYFFDSTQGAILEIIVKIAVSLLVFALLMLGLVLESLWHRPLSRVSFGYFLFSFALIGVVASQGINLQYYTSSGWAPIFEMPMYSFLTLDFAFVFFIASYRFFNFMHRGFNMPLSLKQKIGFWISVISIAFAAGFGFYIITGRPFLIIFVILGGSTITGILYLGDPNHFFHSNAQLQQLLLFDGVSGIEFLSFGATDIASPGIFGSTLIEKEISESRSYPTKYVFPDKVFLIESVLITPNHPIYAILILDRDNWGLRYSLKYLVKLFANTYRNEILTGGNATSEFFPFAKKVVKIFNYALKKEHLNENNDE